MGKPWFLRLTYQVAAYFLILRFKFGKICGLSNIIEAVWLSGRPAIIRGSFSLLHICKVVGLFDIYTFIGAFDKGAPDFELAQVSDDCEGHTCVCILECRKIK